MFSVLSKLAHNDVFILAAFYLLFPFFIFVFIKTCVICDDNMTHNYLFSMCHWLLSQVKSTRK